MRPQPAGSAVQTSGGKPEPNPIEPVELGQGHRMLRCVDCGAEFAFTVGEQRWFQERNLTQPKRCKPCRDEKRRQRNGGWRDGE